MMAWAEESHQELIIMLLDFIKAFNRVNWNFLKSVMRWKGFDDHWIR